MQVNRYNIGFGFDVNQFLRNREGRSGHVLRPLRPEDLLTPNERRARANSGLLTQLKNVALRIPFVKGFVRSTTT